MTVVSEMLRTHPASTTVDQQALEECLAALSECAAACTSCADACTTTGRIVLRLSEPDWRVVRAQLEACALACRSCGDECERHAGHMEHCRVCAEACRRCANACDQLLAALPAG